MKGPTRKAKAYIPGAHHSRDEKETFNPKKSKQEAKL
jgi:hypothetical protein